MISVGKTNIPDGNQSDGSYRAKCKSVVWREENNDVIIRKLHDNIDRLIDIIDCDVTSQDDVDRCVNSFCTELNDIVLPHCDVKICQSGSNDDTRAKKRVPNTDKPWFNDRCKALYRDYKGALHNFNLLKSNDNHMILVNKKSQYKKYERHIKRQYQQKEGNMMDYLHKHNPKQFFKYFSKRKKKSSPVNIGMSEFVEHFQNLVNMTNNDPNDADNDAYDSYDAVFDELDAEISETEILTCIRNLNRNKSCSEDDILNELFLDCKDVMIPLLFRLFNSIFKSGYFPESWCKGCVVPIHKKGDVDNVNNYRGITLLSCMGKLFTSILNKRLLDWDKEHSIITDAQFGFRPGFSTIDAIFALHTIIKSNLKKRGGRLYCCFVDYKKAFDLIDRSKLWCKLIKQGVEGKMLNVIISLYDKVKICVKFDGCLSDYFESRVGLFQGEVLSPILYSLYVNDCEIHFIRENCPAIDFNLISVFLLMYADDMVLLSESPEGLQVLLNSLYNYNTQWNLTLNSDKTKIMVFRNGGNLRENEKWFYNGSELETVNEFNYLGMLFNYNGKFNLTQKQLADQGRKAMFALNAKLKNHTFNIETQCSVFDIYVNSILSYASEVWGFHKGLDVERVHTNFCKNTLGVKKNTSNKLVYYELGRLPLHLLRKLRILKYWIKLRRTENCILKECFESRVNSNDDWIISIKAELNKLGLSYLWDYDLNDKQLFSIIKQRFYDVQKQEILSDIGNAAKGELYQHLIDNFCMQYYLVKPIPNFLKKCIARYRTSSHNLNIELGRQRNENRENRLCTLCNLGDIEDEFHFILKCPKFSELRIKYIKKYYFNRPSVFKLVQLLSINNVKQNRSTEGC